MIKCNRFIKTEMKRSARVLRIWSDHPETPRAHHVLQLNPSSRVKLKKLSPQERLVKNIWTSKRFNSLDMSSWKLKNLMWVEVLGNPSRTKCLSSSPAARGKFLSMWKPPDTYDLLHTHSHWTSGDTYISIDCITTKRRRDRDADRIYKLFGLVSNRNCAYKTHAGIIYFDLIHLLLTNYGYALRTRHDMV